MEELYFNDNNIDIAFEKFPILEDENYIIRQPKDIDWKDIIEIYSNKELLIVDRLPQIYDKDAAKEFITFIRFKYKYKERIDWSIYSNKDKKCIGLVGIYNISKIDARAEIGYIMSKKYMRKGIMTMALNKVLGYLFNNLKFNRIEANVYKENLPSIRLCEKLKFSLEGVRLEYMYNDFTGIYMDSYIFSILNNNKN
ncbi:GNAT family N-acetyltransferase [Clostridium tarantellae]|uniref:GNAT family N-acetyltransferase n=1 Tax=Clostridium tarantellae TaxID=39493 RepID=A0A6I1MNF4_9CLOT|nr:GNAT family N-acetyltransferase [Clostridium tarantellae]MPQ45026.1 GNAT family N-acetyltransferase [Clostridium tarantellae]